MKGQTVNRQQSAIAHSSTLNLQRNKQSKGSIRKKDRNIHAWNIWTCGHLLRRWSVKVMVVHSERGTLQQKDTLQGREITVGTCVSPDREEMLGQLGLSDMSVKCPLTWNRLLHLKMERPKVTLPDEKWRDVEQYLGLWWRRDSVSLRKQDRDGLNLCPALQLRLIYFSRHTRATANTQEESEDNQPVLWRTKGCFLHTYQWLSLLSSLFLSDCPT